MSGKISPTFLLSESRGNLKGGAIKRPIEEHAFDCIIDEDKNKLPLFLKGMFAEIFIYSNFCLFNGDDYNIITTRIQKNTVENLDIRLIVERKGKPLALASVK